MITQTMTSKVTKESMDLYPIDEYLKRIQFTGKLNVSAECLFELHRVHASSIPFENLDVLLGKTISFERSELEQKLIMNRRGGYCFEQNHFFGRALESIGFKVTPMIARVRWQVPKEVDTPLSHMVLKVEVGNVAYLADVGFGGVGLIEPIEIEFGKVQHQNYEPRRIIEKGGYWVHQIFLKEEWQDVYVFEPKLASRIDLEVGNWFSCTHPEARFKRDLIVTLANDKRRVVLNNTTLTVRQHKGEAIVRVIESHAELLNVLDREFSLPFPADRRFKFAGLMLA